MKAVALFYKSASLYVVLGLLGLLLSSCAPQAQIDMLERNVSGLQVETNRINEQIQGIKQQLSSVQGQGLQQDRKSLARLSARVDSLESELMRMNGLLEQLKYQQERQEQAITSLQARLGTKPSGVQQPANAGLVQGGGNGTIVGNTSLGTLGVNGTQNVVSRPQGPVQVVPKEAEPVHVDYYQKGLDLYKKGKYREAKEAFKEFIQENPNSPRVANAYFWIGECEYKMSRYEEAILEYNKVLDKFPNSNKVPDALLKQGFAFAKLGDKESARILLKRLLKKYPYSPQAKAAKRQLQLLR